MSVSLFTYTRHIFDVPFQCRCTNICFHSFALLLYDFYVSFCCCAFFVAVENFLLLFSNLHCYLFLYSLFQLTTTGSGDHVQNYTVFYVIMFFAFSTNTVVTTVSTDTVYIITALQFRIYISTCLEWKKHSSTISYSSR